MQILIEDRVDQSIRHLQPSEAEKIERILHLLEQASFEDLRIQFQIHKLSTPGEQVFVLRATPKLRILFRYGADQTIIIEDIVSHEVLVKYFGGGRYA